MIVKLLSDNIALHECGRMTQLLISIVHIFIAKHWQFSVSLQCTN